MLHSCMPQFIYIASIIAHTLSIRLRRALFIKWHSMLPRQAIDWGGEKKTHTEYQHVVSVSDEQTQYLRRLP